MVPLRTALRSLVVTVVVAFACSPSQDAVESNPGTGAATSSGPGGGEPEPDASSSSGTEPECPHTGADVLDPSGLEPCPMCGGGHCIPKSVVPPEQHENLAECNADAFCVPDAIIKSGGDFIPDTCSSLFGGEGRCLSVCLPEIGAQAAALPQDNCPADHVCAPCFDPLDGTPTGACSLSCDPGPTTEPVELPKCCSDIGKCIPTNAIPPEQSAQLAADTCDQSSQPMTCVPDVFLQMPYKPTGCETSLLSALLGDAFKPGACIPDCVPAVQGTINNIALSQDNCPTHFKCAPCLDPLSGDPSGACDGMGCAGFCGAQSGEGCWCDPGCVQYGDCCADACTECSAC